MTMYEEIMCDANVLYKAYLNSLKGSDWKETVQRFSLNFLRHIFSIIDDLENRTLKNGPTNEFTQNERGKIRAITSLCMRDRVIRHALVDDILMPEVEKHIIKENCASIKDRGLEKQREIFEDHLKSYYREYGNNEGWIAFGDFSKFYDNIIHEIAKQQLLDLVNDDEFVKWLLDIIFEGFEIDVSYMSDEEYFHCMEDCFNKNEYRQIPKELKTGEKWMKKSCNIGDQLSQTVGIYYPNRIDTYVKYVRSMKRYGRYQDDWYAMSKSKAELEDIVSNVERIAKELGMHINMKKTRIVKMSSTYKFLQIRYSLRKDGKLIRKINLKRVTSMRRKLKKLYLKCQDGEIPYENIEGMFKGWMGSFYKLMSKERRRNMLKLYEDLFNKSITIKKMPNGKNKMIIVDRT